MSPLPGFLLKELKYMYGFIMNFKQTYFFTGPNFVMATTLD